MIRTAHKKLLKQKMRTVWNLTEIFYLQKRECSKKNYRIVHKSKWPQRDHETTFHNSNHFFYYDSICWCSAWGKLQKFIRIICVKHTSKTQKIFRTQCIVKYVENSVNGQTSSKKRLHLRHASINCAEKYSSFGISDNSYYFILSTSNIKIDINGFSTEKVKVPPSNFIWLWIPSSADKIIDSNFRIHQKRERKNTS